MKYLANVVAVTVALSAALGGCASDPIGGPGSVYHDPVNRDLAARNTRFAVTVAEGAGVGALVGAGVGAGVAAMSGDGGWEGAAIGLGVGLVAGAIAGLVVAIEGEEYAAHEAALSGQIKETSALVVQYQRDLDVTEELVATRIQRIQALQDQIAAGEISADKYEAELAEVDESVDLIRENMDANEEVIELIEEAIDDMRDDSLNTADLEAELDRYRTLREEQLNLLNALLAVQSNG